MTLCYILVLYLLIFAFSTYRIHQLMRCVGVKIRTNLRSEIRLHHFRSAKHFDVENMLKIAGVMVESYQSSSLKLAVIQQSWMCFLVMSCSLLDSQTFETRFKREFYIESLKAVSAQLQEIDDPIVKEFINVIESCIRKEPIDE